MEHTFCFSGERNHRGQRVLEGIALVDDAVQSEFHGQFHLLTEKFGLTAFVIFEVGVVRFTIVIQSGFANGDDFWVTRQFAKARAHIFRRVQNVVRMPAYRRINVRKGLSNFNRPPTRNKVGADGYDFRDAGVRRALNDVGEVRLEIRETEMSMCIVKQSGED